MIRSILSISTAFTVFAALGAYVSAPRTASAAYVQMHPSACMPSISTTPYTDAGSGHPRYNSTSGTGTFLCPVVDSTDLRHDSVTYLTVSVHDGNSTSGANVSATACTSDGDSLGGACGSTASTSGTQTGIFHLQPGFGGWGAGTAGDYAYIRVVLPALGSSSYISGYYMAG